MSLPPNVIRVKRKRVEEAPVTFLQLDQGAKRHRSDSNWVYKRKSSNAQQQRNAAPSEDVRPVIHLSQPEAKEPPSTKTEVPITKPEETREIDSKKPPPSPSKEPRRFHVSRAMLAAASKPPSGSIFKKDRYGPTLFVERTRREKLAPNPRKSLLVHQQLEQELAESNTAENAGIQQKDLKRPGIAKKARQVSREVGEEETKRNPLPPSFTNRQDENMDKIAQDMNDWVLAEVGANIESMDADKKKTETHRFKPKAPAKRYQERHPEVVPSAVPADTEGDVNMMDGSEEEGDDEDWIIEEYIRIPANAVTMDVNPSEMGFLMLEGEEESLLFFGPQNDDEDEWAEDEEDENAENYYTADYPEDEVDSADEYDRQAYCFRNGNASDDEEYDQNNFDDDVSVEGQEDDDDARMTRILEQMKKLRATQQ